MKKLLLILLCLPFIGFGQQTYVPDDNFEQALINFGYDNILDDSVLTSNINTITSLDISFSNISDLTGIEDFIALTSLNCENNQLTSIDVSQNTALYFLRCNNNFLSTLDVSNNTALTTLYCGEIFLTTLDVSNNTALTVLDCWDNQLTSLDVSNNTSLIDLHCSTNQLTTLDVSNNSALTYLYCGYNQCTSLDISGATALTNLNCQDNQLTSLDLSNNTFLNELDCRNNQLTSLDISQSTFLTYLNCQDNQLSFLDVSNNSNLSQIYCFWNQLTTLDVSQNAFLTYLECWDNQLTILDVSNNIFLNELDCRDNQLTSLDVRTGNNITMQSCWTSNNPNLYCINVDDAAWSTANWTTNIDSWTSFDTNCANAAGCTDITACNYDSIASIDDNSCVYNTVSYDTVTAAGSYAWGIYNLTSSGDYTDTLINSVGCDSIAYLNLTITIPSGILNITNTEKTLLKITNILGQETPYRRNIPLFYIYDDGTVEKRIVIE